jgi:hypothetical protein
MANSIILRAAVLAVFGGVLSASTIVDVSGPFSFNYTTASPDPFGNYDYVASSWTQTGSFSGVSVSLTGNAVFASPVDGTAYLTTAFGPGITSADQIASSSFSITGPASGSELLFSALSLGAGTYYLVIAANPGGEIGWNATASPVVTTAGGVTLNSGFACFNATPVNYPPSGGSCQSAGGMLFDVSGTAAPEAPSALLVGMATLSGIYLRKKSPGKKSPRERSAGNAPDVPEFGSEPPAHPTGSPACR